MCKLTLEQAVKLWINRDFSCIPTLLIKRAYRDNPEDLELLSSEYPELDYPSGWGYMFHPECSLDEQWIRENIDVVESLACPMANSLQIISPPKLCVLLIDITKIFVAP